MRVAKAVGVVGKARGNVVGKAWQFVSELRAKGGVWCGWVVLLLYRLRAYVTLHDVA